MISAEVIAEQRQAMASEESQLLTARQTSPASGGVPRATSYNGITGPDAQASS